MKWVSDIMKRWKKPAKEEQAGEQEYGSRVWAGGQHAAADVLTPKKLVSILREAEAGDILRQSELFEEMEIRDGDLDGLLRQRKAGVTACDYEIVPGDEDDPRSVKAAEFCKQMIGGIPYCGDRIADMLDAIPKAFSCMEIIWDTSEGSWMPVNLKFKPQRWWQLDPVDHNRLRLRDDSDYQGIEVNPLNFIQHIHHARSGALSRAGLSLSCTRPFVIRNYSWKDWLAFGEIFGHPIRLGKLPPGATQEQADLLWAALKALGTDAAGMIPDGAAIEFAQVHGITANADFFEKLINLAGRTMQIVILGQTLTSGGEGGGAYALGKVHQNVRYDLVDSDAKRIDETISTQLYTPVTHLNFGPDVAAPRHVTQVEEPEDRKELSEVIKNLREAGMPIPQSYVREKFSIPEPQDDEPLLEAPAPVSPMANSRTVANAAADEKKKTDDPARFEQSLARSLGYPN